MGGVAGADADGSGPALPAAVEPPLVDIAAGALADRRGVPPAIGAVVAAVDALIDTSLASPNADPSAEPGVGPGATPNADPSAAPGAASNGQATAAAPPPGLWREALALGKRLVHERFVAGAPAAELLAGRTAVVDRVLTRLWEREGAAFDGLALLAVGGYGRGELHPASDVDIAVLLPRHGDSAREERLSAWITALWDLGLDIGHSVRTVSDCEREARGDITVITNLMEARLLCGDAELLALMRRVLSPEQIWPPAAFLAAKLAEREARAERFHTNAYRLEPNVKESHGGLRDFQTLAWVCQRQFGRPGLEPLVDNGLLEPQELVTLTEGLELLWRTRYLLHHLAGRREDRLLFDYQRDIAHAFGHTGGEGNRDIEALMQRYYRTVMALQRLAEIVLQGLGGIISGVTASAPVTPLGKRYQLRNGFLEVRDEHVFVHYPPALLEIFLVYSETPEADRLRANTVRLIRKHLPLINDRFRSDPLTRSLFVSLFRLPRRLTRTIRLMNGYGVLAAYLPAFDAIVGRMQYDLFHIYTVDEHTINVIRNLRRFAVEEHAHELPHCSAVAAGLERCPTLYLTALFHDIAKGRGGDHSVLGAADAADFAHGHGLDARDTDLMVWTVRHHLLMSMTAQNKDIDDPSVQLDFARTVGTLERLDHLYLLTVADIRATNPELWNSFKRSLLQSLYRHARLILERGLDNALGEETVIARRQANTLPLLDAPYADDPRREALWESLGESYFRQYQAAEIARHTEILLASPNTPGPLVSLRHSPSRGSTEILIHTTDHEALFALITTLLETLGLDVLSATINTTADGWALDTFHVLESDGTLIDEPERIEEIRLALSRALRAPCDIPALATRLAPRRLRHFDVSTTATFGETAEAGLTELRISACDRPGILSTIGRVLLGENVAVRAARIATLGERIDDVFFVGRPDGGSLDDPAVRERLADALRERL